mgnify:CR=1 FL=1
MFGIPKLPSNTPLTRRWFRFLMGGAAKKLYNEDKLPVMMRGGRNLDQMVTWKEFNKALCCIIPEGFIDTSNRSEIPITIGEANRHICCIHKISNSIRVPVSDMATEISVKVKDFVNTTTPADSLELGAAITAAYSGAGETPPGVSVSGNDGDYTITLDYDPGESREIVTFSIGAVNWYLITPLS